MSRRRISVQVLSLLVMTACAGRAPSSEPVPAPEPADQTRPAPVPPAGTPLPARAAFHYSSGTAEFTVTSNAVISSIDASGGPLRLAEQARISLRLEPGERFVLVNATVLGLEQTPAAAPPQLPAVFVDTLWAASPAPAGTVTDQLCGRNPQQPRHLTSFLPAVGGDLQQGQRWERAYVYSICHGPIPLRVERTDSYRVEGRVAGGGPDAIIIARTSTLRMSGRGVDAPHNVRIDGTGTARATFQLDARAGWLATGTEESVSEIGVTASGRTQRFRQEVTRRINRL